MSEMQRPWCIQLEPTEGCNYSCWFCGIHAIRETTNWHQYRYMDPALIREAFRDLRSWLPKIRVELNLHGEPTLNPKLNEILRGIKEFPQAQIQMQTNGSEVEDPDAFEDRADEWYDAGLNLYVLNCYKRWWGEKRADSRYGYFLDLAKRYTAKHPEIQLIDFYGDNPKHISTYHYHSPTKKFLFVMNDLGDVNTAVRAETGRPVSKDVTNMGGNSPQGPQEKLMHKPRMTAPLQKMCTRVYRELIFGWNGEVSVCCVDWSAQLTVGVFPRQSLKEIWYSDIFNVVRELLHRKNRNFTPCSNCDYMGGWRQGLVTPPELTDTDAELLEKVRVHMETYKQYTHPRADVVIGMEELKAGRK